MKPHRQLARAPGRNRARPVLERLEGRALLSASLVNELLEMLSTDQSDILHLSLGPNRPNFGVTLEGTDSVSASYDGVSTQAAVTTMHVESIYIQHKDMLGRGPRPLVEAIVWIKDQSGNPISGATVTGDFSGCFTKANASAKTDMNGQAFVLGGKFTCTEPCALTFTVTSVSNDGMTYDPSANVETSDSVSCG